MDLKQLARLGAERRLVELEEEMTTLRAFINNEQPAIVNNRRTMSPEARRRIGAAVRARWAAKRAQMEKAPTSTLRSKRGPL